MCSPADIRVPASLAFHIGDIYLEELDKVLADTPLSACPLSTTLSPFFTLAARTQAKLTYKHIQDTVFDPIFDALQTSRSIGGPSKKRQKLEPSYSNIVENSCVSDPKGGVEDKVKLRTTLLRRIFDVASEEGTRDSNRRKMYALFQAAKEDKDDSNSGSDT